MLCFTRATIPTPRHREEATATSIAVARLRVTVTTTTTTMTIIREKRQYQSHVDSQGLPSRYQTRTRVCPRNFFLSATELAALADTSTRLK